MYRTLVLLLALAQVAGAQPSQVVISPGLRDALDHISPNSLRGHLSFIASDLLAGRDTPSPGLDIAAEYIAAQFRRAGLEPGGDAGSYFQNATLNSQQPDLEGFTLKLTSGEHTVSVAPADAGLQLTQALNLVNAPLIKLHGNDEHADLNGQVVILEMDRTALRRLRSAKPALIILVDRILVDRAGAMPAQEHAQLIDPEDAARPPRIVLHDPAAIEFFDHIKAGQASISIHAPAAKTNRVTVRNVIAILRGSDPALKDTCVLLTAHYDHLGAQHNGANDDGSGTVSVIEIASALAGLKERPKRSIVFAAFFGEEKGLLGSRYYVRHPAFPLSQTVAGLNLEQLGRTDSSDGEQREEASLTGSDYSGVGEYVKAAGKLTGIQIHKHDSNSDLYFPASDNYSLAEAGVPAHTLAVAYQFSDYHRTGDDWPKVDFENMAKVDRMAAVAVVGLASSVDTPQWNQANGKADRFRKAREESRP